MDSELAAMRTAFAQSATDDMSKLHDNMPTVIGVLDTTRLANDTTFYTFDRLYPDHGFNLSEDIPPSFAEIRAAELCEEFVQHYGNASYRVLGQIFDASPQLRKQISSENEAIFNIVIEILNHV